MTFGAELSTIVKAEAISKGINYLLGFKPSIQYTDTGAQITLSPGQELIARNWFESQIESKEPSDLNINLAPIVAPYTIKKIIPFAIGAIVLGMVLGYIIKR